jgi:hypothetical protein
MQSRYIGDYMKLGILRALSPGYCLGVEWWLYPDGDHSHDGRHVGYLTRPEQWRHYDPELFDALAGIVTAEQRNIRALEAANILPGAIFSSEVTPSHEPATERRHARQKWLSGIIKRLAEAYRVFLDPFGAGPFPRSADVHLAAGVMMVRAVQWQSRSLRDAHSHSGRTERILPPGPAEPTGR